MGELLDIIIKTDTYLVEKLSSPCNVSTGHGSIFWHEISLPLPKRFIFYPERQIVTFPTISYQTKMQHYACSKPQLGGWGINCTCVVS